MKMITDPKNPISKLSRKCRNNQNKFVKKTMLIGYSNDTLSNYLTDYVISVAKVEAHDCRKYIEPSVHTYNKFPNNVYGVFKIQRIFHNTNHYRFPMDMTFAVDVEQFECYDDAYAYIDTELSKGLNEKQMVMFVMIYKLDDEVCDMIHKEIYDLTSLSNVNFKPTNKCLQLWVNVPVDLTTDDILERIIKLEKNNYKDRSIKASYNEPAIRSMIINVSDYRLLARLKLTHPWIFKDVYKIDYGMKAVKQKLEDSDVERLP